MFQITADSFASGTDRVRSDQTANIHRNEIIVPAKESEFLRSGDLALTKSGNNSSNDIIVNVSVPADAVDRSILESNAFKLADIIGNGIKNKLLQPFPQGGLA